VPAPTNLRAAAIRPLAADEWRELRALRLAALADAPFAFGSTLAREQAHDEVTWRTWAGRTERPIFVAVRAGDGAFVGLAGIGRALGEDGEASTASTAHLWGMWVVPAERRSGIGARLVEAALGWARAERLTRVRLLVTGTNPGAAAFYTRLGFRPTGRESPLGRDPAVTERELALEL
jgi:GNAT superfamily N-acetyltransferase